MGLDLTLAPDSWTAEGLPRQSPLLAYTRIQLDRDYQIFSQIKDIGREGGPVVCNLKPIPEGTKVKWYEDEGLTSRTDDAYGEPLFCVYARELAKVNLQANTNAWNKAAFAFIRALPPDTVIVLWWH